MGHKGLYFCIVPSGKYRMAVSMIIEGLILKGIGGFYYVETTDGIFECRARGKFRKDKITPLAGDHVTIDAAEDLTGFVTLIHTRKNYLIRPPVANVDHLFIICSLKDPKPDTYMIDKTVAAAELREIEPVIVITKTDFSECRDSAERLQAIYQKAGIACHSVSSITGEGTKAVQAYMEGGISALTGNSGAGKSTLLNAIFPDFQLKTGEISQKLGRGRHTTREVELHKIGLGAYVADTPGFSTYDVEHSERTDKSKLIYGFRDMMRYFGECKFTSCTHTCEKGCAVLEAVEKGSISRSRWNSYHQMFNEVKDRKQWQINKNV